MTARIAILYAVALGGCAASVEMYPVEGPLSKLVPLPVVKAKAEGIAGNSGALTLTLPDGQACQGRWSSVAPRYAGNSSGALLTAYGQYVGFNTADTGIVPGVNRGEAFASCNAGTTVQMEFVTGSGTANGYGVAKDSAGNVYKMLF